MYLTQQLTQQARHVLPTYLGVLFEPHLSCLHLNDFVARTRRVPEHRLRRVSAALVGLWPSLLQSHCVRERGVLQ